jgi:hypothetical protein
LRRAYQLELSLTTAQHAENEAARAVAAAGYWLWSERCRVSFLTLVSLSADPRRLFNKEGSLLGQAGDFEVSSNIAAISSGVWTATEKCGTLDMLLFENEVDGERMLGINVCCRQASWQRCL